LIFSFLQLSADSSLFFSPLIHAISHFFALIIFSAFSFRRFSLPCFLTPLLIMPRRYASSDSDAAAIDITPLSLAF